MKIEKYNSPNFNARKNGGKPKYLILHATFTETEEEAFDVYMDASTELSCHYMVCEDGRIQQFVDEEMRAWHAGKSFWRGETDLNSWSIGIEADNRKGTPFPDVQIKALITLCKDICVRHAIPPENVLAHSDIAPGRKSDPGDLFPWEKLAEEGVVCK